MSNTVQDKLWNKLDEYYDTFQEAFPTMCFPLDTPQGHLEKIQECLDKSQPAPIVFDLKYTEDRKY